MTIETWLLVLESVLLIATIILLLFSIKGRQRQEKTFALRLSGRQGADKAGILSDSHRYNDGKPRLK